MRGVEISKDLDVFGVFEMKVAILPAEYRRFPKYWKTLRFTEAFEDKTGGQTKIQKGEYLDNGLLPIVDQGQSLFGGFTDNLDAACNIELPCILFGDHTKKIKYIEKTFALGADGVKVLKQRDDIEPKFAYYYLNTLNLPDVGYSRHFRFLKRTFFPLPPLEEQRRIAAILDKADGVRRKRQEAIRLTEELLRSQFLEMFGDPVTNRKGWDVKTIGQICNVTKLAGFEYTEYVQYQDAGEIIALRALNVKNGRLKLNDIKFINKSISDFLKRSKLFRGDVVMTYIGVNIGDVAVIGEDNKYHLAPNVAKISPSKIVDSIYLMRCLEFNKSQFAKYTTNTAKQALNMNKIRGIEIPLPPLSLQQRFNEHIEKIQRLELRNRESFNETNDLFNSLLQRAFRGEL